MPADNLHSKFDLSVGVALMRCVVLRARPIEKATDLAFLASYDVATIRFKLELYRGNLQLS